MTPLVGFALVASIIGNLAFGFKSLSQVIKCVKNKSVYGISPLMLILDFIGNIGCGYSIFVTTGFTLWPQFVNYFCATLFLIMLFVCIFAYRNKKETLYGEGEIKELRMKARLWEIASRQPSEVTSHAVTEYLEENGIKQRIPWD